MFDSSIPYNELSADFIARHSSVDPKSLLLKYHGRDLGFNLDFAVLQIECRRKTTHKLANFIKNPAFLFPTSVSAEQASHSAVASFHSSLITSGTTLLDMTAGLGIDVMTMAQRASEVNAVEMDKIKCDVLAHNCRVLGLKNINVINSDSVEWLKNCGRTFETIYIDPARRDSTNSRVYGLKDCIPDVVAIQDLLKERCINLFIKGSPLLDISQTLLDLRNVRSIRVICVEGECKEVLIEIGEMAGELLKDAVDLHEDGSIKSRFSYSVSNDNKASLENIQYAATHELHPGQYLYEPNAAIMKLSPWKELQCCYPDLIKLAPDSHLFISPKIHNNFPGRVLIINDIITGKDKKKLKGQKLNVVVRNYPISAIDLRKKLGLHEGKDGFLIGTKIDKPVLIVARRDKTATLIPISE